MPSIQTFLCVESINKLLLKCFGYWNRSVTQVTLNSYPCSKHILLQTLQWLCLAVQIPNPLVLEPVQTGPTLHSTPYHSALMYQFLPHPSGSYSSPIPRAKMMHSAKPWFWNQLHLLPPPCLTSMPTHSAEGLDAGLRIRRSAPISNTK